ncbi:pyridoxamine 5'-phosphate oxidase family protein [Halomicroarcula sp. GCM10025709]|uniref:pyridoxamine 5'-phosphate oxidase family protein n=1 Tax=Haloarcula TaxID=2237 RepID=UPI0024C3387A|nr:pyridoxamine 5'-phosphate oxidase family protein [Halomicroarcula sp. YJ-61-S]
MSLSEEVESLIADAPLSAHLATSVDDRPHVAPVWYVYENSETYRAVSDRAVTESPQVWLLTGGKKLRNVRQNPRVALSIERADESGVDWAAQLLGTARIVDDERQVATIEAALDRKYRGGEGTTDGGTDAGEDGTDGGEEWALLAVRVGSGTAQRYGSESGEG